jgi:hypothetical protein
MKMQRHLSVDEIRKMLVPNIKSEMKNGKMPKFDCPPPQYDEVPDNEKGWNFFTKVVIGSS